MLTHGTVLFAALNPIIDLDLVSDEVALVGAPLCHTAALDFLALPTLLKGGTVRIEEGFDAERVLHVIWAPPVFRTFSTMCAFPARSASRSRRESVARSRSAGPM